MAIRNISTYSGLVQFYPSPETTHSLYQPLTLPSKDQVLIFKFQCSTVEQYQPIKSASSASAGLLLHVLCRTRLIGTISICQRLLNTSKSICSCPDDAWSTGCATHMTHTERAVMLGLTVTVYRDAVETLSRQSKLNSADGMWYSSNELWRQP